MNDLNIAVVIPAAGNSQRCPGQTPKQYYPVLGKPLLMHSVETFYALSSIKKICIVSDMVEYVTKMCKGKLDKIIVVAGGISRHMSIKNGLTALQKLKIDFKIVIVHDGARPIVPESLLMDLIDNASEYGAAGATRPLTSTVIKPNYEKGCVEQCLNRDNYVASETPQAFLFDKIWEAYQKASNDELENGTECLALLLKHCKISAKLLPGSEDLWKVTHKKDCYAVVATLKEANTRVCLVNKSKCDIKNIEELIKKDLVDKVAKISSFENLEGNLKFTSVVCFCDNFSIFEDILDLNANGLVIYVIFESLEKSFSIQELHDNQEMYKKVKKDVVFVYVTSLNEEERLTKLITSLILSDSGVHSGQTIFL